MIARSDEKSSRAPHQVKRLTRESFNLLRKRAEEGDERALQMLKEYVAAHPQLVDEVGDVGRLARESMIRATAEGDQLVMECVRRKAAKLEAELLGENPTAAQRLTVQRVIAAWLEVSHLDRMAIAVTNTGQAKAIAKLKESADRRLQRALRSLEDLQRLQAKPKKPCEQRKGRVAQPLRAGDGASMPANRIKLFMDREETVEAEV